MLSAVAHSAKETGFPVLLRICVASGSFKEVLKENINLASFKSTFEPLCTVRTIQ